MVALSRDPADTLRSTAPELRPRTSWTQRALLAGLLSILLLNCLYYQPYVVDDAFISMRYARNLVEGRGLVFNPGERVEGFSNFLWVLVSAAFTASGLAVLTGIKVTATLAGLATGWLTFLLGRVVFEGRKSGHWMALLAAAGVCTSTSLAVWTQGGLETPLFAALLVAMCYRFELERRGQSRIPWSAVLFALAWMTRPEAPAYGLYFLVRRWQDRTPLDRRDGAWIAVFLAVVVPYEAWGLWYFGKLLPNTHSAKIGDGASFLGKAFNYRTKGPQIYPFLFQQGWAFVAFWGLGLIGCLSRRRYVPIAAWAPVVSGLTFVLYAGADWMPRFRFMVPLLPAFFLMLAAGLWGLGALLAERRVPSSVSGLALIVVFLGYAHYQLFEPYYVTRKRDAFTFPTAPRDYDWVLEVPGNLGRRIYPLEGITKLILETAAPGETVAIGDIGLPAFVSMNPIWDLRGLVTPAAARLDPRDPATVEAALDDLFGARPVFMWVPSVRDHSGKMPEFEAAIHADPRSSRYERIEIKNGVSVLYMRKKRLAVPPGRIDAARAAFPEYGPALERVRPSASGR